VPETDHGVGRKFFIATHGFTQSRSFAGIRESGIDALPKCLRQRHFLGEGKCHGRGCQLLRGHEQKVIVEAPTVKVPTPPFLNN
jgi:hypothetical protein